MKKHILCLMLALAVTVSPAFAINYLTTPVCPLQINGIGVTAQLQIDLQAVPAGIITAGFWFQDYDATVADVSAVAVFDGSNGPPGPWDPGLTAIVDDPSGPNTLFVAVGNLASVGAAGDKNLGIVTLTGAKPGCTGISISTIPGFDTVVGDSTVYDPDILPITCEVCVSVPPCTCSVTGASYIKADANDPVTSQYTAAAGADCVNPASYVWSDTCVNGDVDQNGLLTVPPRVTGDPENCQVCVTDTANTNNVTGQPVTCCADVTLDKGQTCSTEIALGRACPGEVIDDPAYNRPGRRGLAATCNDVIDFTVCSDCESFDPECLVWSVSPATPFLSFTQIDECCWRLNIGESCSQLDKVETYEITVNDTCANSADSVMIEIGKVIVDIGDTTVQPNTESAMVDINLINPAHHVRAVSFDIQECRGGVDNLACTGCVIDPTRTLDFTCSSNEQPDGSCRVILYTTNPAALILQGKGPVARVVYQAGAEVASSDCLCLRPVNIQISDRFNEDLCACQSPGEVCFRTCGDIYPQDCLGGTCGALTTCGDGVVNLFDILEGIDIILGLQTATLCQAENGDVPNGMPPYCGNPPGRPNCDSDGDIDIFDVLVLIDKALGKMNCCDYCLFGRIY